MIDLKNLKLEDAGSVFENYQKNVENATVDTLVEDFKRSGLPYMIYCSGLLTDECIMESWQHLAVLMMLCGGNKQRQQINSVALDELFKTIDAKLRKEIHGDEEDQN